MNDPNGPIFWQGQYHMFFQYNPGAAVWGDMHWAHAASPDMVHWRHLPIALSPTPGGPDAQGCFSGSTVDVHGVPTILYTGVANAPERDATLKDGTHSFRETQCIATADGPGLLRWKKQPTPVIAAPPSGLEVTGFRDPAPWRQGDTWYAVIGSGVRGEGGMALLYRSKDFRHWEYMHPLAQGTGNGSGKPDPVDSGEMWECPDFFPLGQGRHVLIYSTERKVFWQSGTLDGGMRFHADRSGQLDYGAFYAPKTQLDKFGNRILWGWIQEKRPEAEYSAAGWAGMFSLPRVLDVDGDGALRMRFAPALAKLRGTELKPGGGKSVTVPQCTGEVLCDVLRSDRGFSLVFSLQGEGGAPVLALDYDPRNRAHVVIDGTAVEVSGHDPLSVHCFVDGSVMELILNSRQAVTKRFYYGGKTAPSFKVSYAGDKQDLVQLSAWQIQPISKDRLTT